MNEQMNEWLEWLKKRKSKWMNEWTNKQTNKQTKWFMKKQIWDDSKDIKNICKKTRPDTRQSSHGLWGRSSNAKNTWNSKMW